MWPLSHPPWIPVCPILWYPSLWIKALDWALQRHQGHSQPLWSPQEYVIRQMFCHVLQTGSTRFWVAVGPLWSLMNHIQHWFPYVSNPELIMELLQSLKLLSRTPEITNYTWELFKNPKTKNAFYYGELVHRFFYIHFVMARGLVTCCLQSQPRIDLPFSHKSFSGKESTTWDIMYGSKRIYNVLCM